MASTSTLSLALAVTKIGQRSLNNNAFFQPLSLSAKPNLRAKNGVGRLEVKASGTIKEQAVAGLATVAIVATLAVPEIAEAAQSGVSLSLKNFLFSIVSGGLVVGVIIGAVVAVANFDPVKRR